MSIKLLEHIRDELRGSGAVQNTPEFCTSWLGRSEGYIRVLRFHKHEPSVEALSVCSHKLGQMLTDWETVIRTRTKLGFNALTALKICVIKQSPNKPIKYGENQIGWERDGCVRNGSCSSKNTATVFSRPVLTEVGWWFCFPPSLQIRLPLWMTERKCADWLM